MAGLASIGAGAIHLAAIGPHADDPAAAGTFAILGLAQLTWGAVALTARRTWIGVVGLALSLGAVAGWILAKSSGIGLITGLGDPERLQRADVAAALLAAAAAVLIARRLLVGDEVQDLSRRTLVLSGGVILAFTALGIGSTSGHSHVHGDDLGPIGQSHGPGVVPPIAYDPADPIDLSGVSGVTAKEQAGAERLVRDTLARAERYADVDAARAAGYRPVTTTDEGTERWIRFAALDDGHVVDPRHPEALLYDVGPDGRTLVAVQYLLPPGTDLEDAPRPGGSLTAWRAIDDLCVAGTGDRARVDGVASVDGSCPSPTQPLEGTAGLHVWLVPHACGPFSGVERADQRAGDGAAAACGSSHGG